MENLNEKVRKHFEASVKGTAVVFFSERWTYQPINPKGKVGHDAGRKICVYPVNEGTCLYLKTYDYHLQRGNYVGAEYEEFSTIRERREIERKATPEEQLAFLGSLPEDEQIRCGSAYSNTWLFERATATPVLMPTEEFEILVGEDSQQDVSKILNKYVERHSYY